MTEPVTPPLAEWNVHVGALAGVYGLRGEVRVRSLSEVPDRFAVGSTLCAVHADGRRQALTIVRSRPHRAELLVAFEGFATREAAEALRGAALTIADSMRRELPPDRYYHDQLVGLTIVTCTGRDLGVVENVLETPASDVLVTDRAMVPLARDLVREIALADRRIIVEDRPGLETDHPHRGSAATKPTSWRPSG